LVSLRPGTAPATSSVVTPDAARILKGAAPLPAVRIPAAVHEADRQVRERIAAAEADAGRIHEEAERAAGALRAEAVEEGRREGMARAAAALARAAAERDRRLAAAEREVVAIALAVARRILGRELAERPAAVAELAARALAEARERREVVLRVGPADAPAVRDAEGALGALLVRARLAVREDAALAPGAVVVETEDGRIDAGLEAQLDRLRRALEEVLPP
jgi:type III secretion protein L